MYEQDPPPGPGDELDALVALVEAGGFHRLVPAWVPREFAPPTRELTLRVAHGLRRQAHEQQ
ncbi:hypothetical protein [Streptomyces liangshanensis]|uniref:Uncharacterized protein n=1 Tax=Streptomyces liangshanensis TaxID=2717324 RepID=A0A6G9H1E5_9ACTN|nr:hypothetical protein [Streptomyces liangshanensis]QIQ04280.1 hypothetical protein HA039_19975 [Streptomyces liangshanensis]